MNADLKIALVQQNGQVSFSADLMPYETPQGLHQWYVVVKAQNYQWPPHHGCWKLQVSLKSHLTFLENLEWESQGL
jgi:hypothetical protein